MWDRILDYLGEPNRITGVLMIRLLKERQEDQSQRRCEDRSKGQREKIPHCWLSKRERPQAKECGEF